MNLQRALLKATIFHITFGMAFFLTYFFTPDPPRITTRRPPAPRVFNVAADMAADAEMVVLDRANARSYARLRLSLYVGRPAPERLRARTYFFLPGDPARRVWVGEGVEILRPFEKNYDPTVNVAAPCGLCDDKDAPRGGYFARVQLYADGVETPLPAGEQFFDPTTATPVLFNVETPRAP